MPLVLGGIMTWVGRSVNLGVRTLLGAWDGGNKGGGLLE